jgi:MoxR-like ATPase
MCAFGIRVVLLAHSFYLCSTGVGKNKLADRLIHLLGAEREYMQLHRDSTVQSLTLVPSLVDGKIVYEDSPLVRAAKTGRIAVIDEADKASLEVVGLIKSLVEDGEMLLYNGKRLLTSKRLKEYAPDGAALPDNIIPVTDGFKVWVLANRPGFPFLGNNFFRECGDVFACHVIDNPDQSSEVRVRRFC